MGALQQWIKKHEDLVLTGNNEFDQILKVLLETSMFVAGFLGFFLDNTIPGTREERGLIAWAAQHKDSGSSDGTQSYSLPLVQGWLEGQTWAQYIPCLPTFTGLNQGKDKSRV